MAEAIWRELGHPWEGQISPSLAQACQFRQELPTQIWQEGDVRQVYLRDDAWEQMDHGHALQSYLFEHLAYWVEL